jgi:hypothetical protein
MPIIVKNLGNGKASLDIEACREISDPRYPGGVESFQKLKMEYILTQRIVNLRGDFTIHDFGSGCFIGTFQLYHLFHIYLLYFCSY